MFSELNAKLDSADVLIIDNIGHLKYLYKYADLAIIGGAWHIGLHNILEAAVYGIPVLFGPNTNNFPEAQDLIAFGGAKQVLNKSDFPAILDQCLLNEKTRKEMGRRAMNYVEQNRGALQKSYEILFTETTAQ